MNLAVDLGELLVKTQKPTRNSSSSIVLLLSMSKALKRTAASLALFWAARTMAV